MRYGKLIRSLLITIGTKSFSFHTTQVVQQVLCSTEENIHILFDVIKQTIVDINKNTDSNQI